MTTSPSTKFDPRNYYKGIMHIHSEYSHDGHDTIQAMSSHLNTKGIDFCVLTDHFEDFDENKFQKYIADLDSVNSLRQTIFIPAIEAEFLQFHIIFLPVSNYNCIRSFIDRQTLPEGHPLKFLVHPTKYPLTDVVDFLKKYHLDGVEIWNQQVDGIYLPPERFTLNLMQVFPVNPPAVFFGLDIHKVKHRISNLLLIPRDGVLTPGLVIDKLRNKDFVNYSLILGRHLPGNSRVEAINYWFNELEEKDSVKLKVIRNLRNFLKSCYHLLPASAKLYLDDFKNNIKNQL